ncbi:hypothetical protein JX265_011300 [Neoarthrinium moseri]|uniref:EF-hand domain-containing protein n=1 Tax=Neoarthrinium moseri TaxID=1658444 RepID=A0A9Q0AKU6_9PEZI|nr:uncharacterized protein JN550_006332 [Neoarthrinium moseri]KAI1844763.1 hypothetical protein JX266_008991 [Neoarthrinium moseri]KAI1857099.1 hypothetical protein JX265_011300 [Neoarthrinium moseri]KAI1868416.1 hypothetical protein JN550_006332 [Neoarthrinium moseri]
MKFFSIALLASAALPGVLSFCCSGPQCADGTGGTPCCATQSCNIFCCACGGHCRGTSSKRELLAFDPRVDESMAAFEAADKSGNGNLTLDDYLEYMSVPDSKKDMWTQWFDKHDKNGDGIITADEISNN